ncbi:hypothetical protein [Streptomyces sp. NPDC096339]|uniref:hypothetical protein n=1 Tax=Streptomyces sp. NPDC096339 TaxID=3366086 RepID=UPI003829A9C9
MAHAAPAAHRQHRQMTDMTHLGMLAYAGPLLLGVVYGFWAAYIERQAGPVTTANVFYGILCGVLFAAIAFGLGRMGTSVMQEIRAAAYGAFGGIAVGYLHSLTNQSILKAVVVGLFAGIGVGVAAFYRFHTHED